MLKNRISNGIIKSYSLTSIGYYAIMKDDKMAL
nr:MAG TPA: hypothetical protein [Caudoviricetes sp.]